MNDSQERFGALIGYSDAMRQLFAQLQLIAASQTAVLVEGETGTGKRLVAREIVRSSDRRARPHVTVECDGVAPAELELKLFGCEPGIANNRVGTFGAFMRADHGTLVFDEIAALPMTAQARLVRTIETGALQRIGGSYVRPTDVRIIAITRQDLGRLCERGQFRRDLYFCLRPRRVRVPPLRERLADLPGLVSTLAAEEGLPAELHADPGFLEWLRGRQWHGNVRELRNLLQRVRVLGLLPVMKEEDALGGRATPAPAATVGLSGPLVDRLEHEFVMRLLRDHRGNIAQAARAARRTSGWLRRRIQHYKIDLVALRPAVAVPAKAAG
jgi:DNA-binding NtrC family response regulator